MHRRVIFNQKGAVFFHEAAFFSVSLPDLVHLADNFPSSISFYKASLFPDGFLESFQQ